MNNKNNNTLPHELLDPRQTLEVNFIFPLYKDPTLVGDYTNFKSGEDVITEDGMFYFDLAKSLYEAGYREFNAITIDEYLSNKPTTQSIYNDYGGFDTIVDLMSMTSVENIEKSVDNLVKSNLLISLYNKGFNVLPNLNKFDQMTAEQVYDWYNYQLANLTVKNISHITESDLSEGYDEYIDTWDKGEAIGYRISSALLNNMILGIAKNKLTLIGSGINSGKSSLTIVLFILCNIEDGNDVCIIANEQTEDDWRQMILSTVVFNKLDHHIKGFNRTKVAKGHYTDEQKQALTEAKDWLAKQKGHIKYYKVFDYDVNTVDKIVSKRSKLGTKLFIYDTFKPTMDSDKQEWQVFSNMATRLSMLADKNEVGIIATFQLNLEKAKERYYDLTTVGKSKAITETAQTVLMFRHLTHKEKVEMNFYTYKRDETGIKRKTEIKIPNPDDDYIVMFVAKSRSSDTRTQIVMKVNLAFNSVEDFGYVNIDPDY